MLLRKRPRSGRSGPRFLLLFLTLGCVLMMVIMLHPPPPTLHQAVTAQANKHSPDTGYRLDFGDSQEWVLEAEDEGEEYSFLDGLPPFISLQEDQLLVAVASPRARRNQSQGRRQGSYQFIKHMSRRRHEKAPEKDWRTEEDGEESEEAVTPLSLDSDGLNKALRARLPMRSVLPEARHPLCLQQHPTSGLPTASIILCFHDETWPTLSRTVHSILDTAPRALLQEIILVDDLSQQEPLKSALSEYVARLEAVKLLRSNKRLGTIGARMLGATRATGDVLVFMDAHCECHPGWLEPLLSRIADDRSRVVSPVIDVIDWKTLQYSSSKLQRGVLDWKLDFRWEPLGEQEQKALPSPISPVRSPVVPREVVAVDRHYFQNTGAYDPLLSLWGSENLEMSFKAWLCGGSVEIIPCSRVGHVYQSQDASFRTDPDEVILRNKILIAETWLASFKETFYRQNPEAFALRKVAKPDCTERLKLQRRLGCRTFHWFLANVYPELYPSEPRPRFSGKLHNTGFGLCADCQAEGDLLGCPMTLAPCSNNRQQQNLEHTSRKEILFGSPQRLCLDVSGEQVILQNCTEEGFAIHQQHWDFQEDGMIIHVLSGKCMDAGVQPSSKNLFLHQCDGKTSQLWRFDQIHPVDER
ncbi:polypeptide N-acetylgalactosaminyltransferase 15 isoform X1 [Arvicanthis niloticus]|uniref:polypeptide N-acetylgalactosaminyltransferase 15 isoform X1 n=3 Tax=Arvicanthis niloticus TaxID=61156 RepID=UPI001486E785|nr:polypeptide N-acetylgalactosaminyltransferase 15 [Arvicanthis niloticus]